jgi:hypothetical protein
MARINVDVDLDDFDLDDLLDEITDRYQYKRNKQQIDDWLDGFIEKPDSMSVMDEIKMKIFTENISQISLCDLEKLIK